MAQSPNAIGIAHRQVLSKTLGRAQHGTPLSASLLADFSAPLSSAFAEVDTLSDGVVMLVDTLMPFKSCRPHLQYSKRVFSRQSGRILHPIRRKA